MIENLPVKINIPKRTRSIPAILFIVGEYVLNFLKAGKILSNATPKITKGVPNPKAKRVRSGIAAIKVDCKPTQKRIAASTGPTQGVQAKPKVIPNKNELRLFPGARLAFA